MIQIKYPGPLQNKLVRHSAFWLFMVIFYTLPAVFNQEAIGLRILNNLLYVPLDMVAVYFSLYYLLPKVMFRKQIVVSAFIYLITIILLAIAAKLLKEYVYVFLPSPSSGLTTLSRELFYSLLTLNMIAGMAIGVKLLMIWFSMQIKSKEMEHEKTQSELVHLRSQLNPHFLFNTLNNIDTLVLQSPERASETLIKLSDILRYCIYETSEDQVPLEKELEYLQNYIDLQKIRLNQPDFVQVKLNGISAGKEIAPMLLIPLVENAFKHGDRKVAPPGISIFIEIIDHQLKIVVENSINQGRSYEIEKVGGIGLKNVRRRLELQYPDKHSLEIEEHHEKFRIQLIIDLYEN